MIQRSNWAGVKKIRSSLFGFRHSLFARNTGEYV